MLAPLVGNRIARKVPPNWSWKVCWGIPDVALQLHHWNSVPRNSNDLECYRRPYSREQKRLQLELNADGDQSGVSAWLLYDVSEWLLFGDHPAWHSPGPMSHVSSKHSH